MSPVAAWDGCSRRTYSAGNPRRHTVPEKTILRASLLVAGPYLMTATFSANSEPSFLQSSMTAASGL